MIEIILGALVSLAFIVTWVAADLYDRHRENHR